MLKVVGNFEESFGHFSGYTFGLHLNDLGQEEFGVELLDIAFDMMEVGNDGKTFVCGRVWDNDADAATDEEVSVSESMIEELEFY